MPFPSHFPSPNHLRYDQNGLLFTAGLMQTMLAISPSERPVINALASNPYFQVLRRGWWRLMYTACLAINPIVLSVAPGCLLWPRVR